MIRCGSQSRNLFTPSSNHGMVVASPDPVFPDFSQALQARGDTYHTPRTSPRLYYSLIACRHGRTTPASHARTRQPGYGATLRSNGRRRFDSTPPGIFADRGFNAPKIEMCKWLGQSQLCNTFRTMPPV